MRVDIDVVLPPITAQIGDEMKGITTTGLIQIKRITVVIVMFIMMDVTKVGAEIASLNLMLSKKIISKHLQRKQILQPLANQLKEKLRKKML